MLHIHNECGQRWYRLWSWRETGVRFRVLRELNTADIPKIVGFSFGPIMVWK